MFNVHPAIGYGFAKISERLEMLTIIGTAFKGFFIIDGFFDEVK